MWRCLQEMHSSYYFCPSFRHVWFPTAHRRFWFCAAISTPVFVPTCRVSGATGRCSCIHRAANAQLCLSHKKTRCLLWYLQSSCKWAGKNENEEKDKEWCENTTSAVFGEQWKLQEQCTKAFREQTAKGQNSELENYCQKGWLLALPALKLMKKKIHLRKGICMLGCTHLFHFYKTQEEAGSCFVF